MTRVHAFQSALFEAACAGDPLALTAALREGAIPQTLDRHGSSVLAAASNNGSEECVRILLAAGGHGTRDLAQAANRACVYGHTGCLRLLIQAGADLDNATLDGEATCAMRAAARNSLDCLRLLAQAGADLEARDAAGSTAAMLAADQGREACRRLLLLAGIEIDSADRDGRSALNVAVERGADDCAEILIASGADIERRDGMGSTPLHRAARYSRREPALGPLLDAGADLDSLDRNGSDAVATASLRGRDDWADMLREIQPARRLARDLQSSLPEAAAKRSKPL